MSILLLGVSSVDFIYHVKKKTKKKNCLYIYPTLNPKSYPQILYLSIYIQPFSDSDSYM
jgi:hypothetical protein